MDRYLPETRSENIGDAELQYLLYAGGEPTIVLQHATGFLPWLWHPIARRLAGTHRVIAPYFCDHRDAGLNDGGLAWRILAEDLAGLSRHLKLKAPVLVGHSMGATVMTFAEAVYGLGAAGMILIEPIFLPEHYYDSSIAVERLPLVSKSLRRRNRWKDAAEVKSYLKSKALFADWEEEFLDLYIEYGTVKRENFGLELTCPPQKEAAIFMGGVAQNPWPLLPGVDCPVLVLAGSKSDAGRVIDYPGVASRFGNGRFQRIADAGHLIPMEKPGEILDIISAFIDSLLPDTPE